MENKEELFRFWRDHARAPYHFPMSMQCWEESWESDTDSEGRKLFNSLQTMVSRNTDGDINGLIQYGTTAFGFDDSGEISSSVHYCVVREFMFEEVSAGQQLLDTVLAEFGNRDQIYAFFHYFGMSACARHGKLHERSTEVEKLLLESGFSVEHENVYYSRTLTQKEAPSNSVIIHWKDPSPGSCREFAAQMEGREVCWGQIHFLPQGDIAYLRWIYVDEHLQHTGIGSRVMCALFSDLYKQGIRRFDTDTALDNSPAQRYYEKNGFLNCGITRSYHTK